MQSPGTQTVYRGTDRILGGVSSGLAEGFHVEVLWVRLAFVVLAFINGVGLLLYVVLWVLMPERAGYQPPGQNVLESMGADIKRAWADLRTQFGSGSTAPASPATTAAAAPPAAGIAVANEAPHAGADGGASTGHPYPKLHLWCHPGRPRDRVPGRQQRHHVERHLACGPDRAGDRAPRQEPGEEGLVPNRRASRRRSTFQSRCGARKKRTHRYAQPRIIGSSKTKPMSAHNPPALNATPATRAAAINKPTAPTSSSVADRIWTAGAGSPVAGAAGRGLAPETQA